MAIAQHLLNNLLSSVSFTDLPNLNVNATSIMKDTSIRLAYNGSAAARFDAMTHQVVSPEPYITVTISFTLTKTSPVAPLFQKQIRKSVILGSGTFTHNTKNLQSETFYDATIDKVGDFEGNSAGVPVEITANIVTNSDMWSVLK